MESTDRDGRRPGAAGPRRHRGPARRGDGGDRRPQAPIAVGVPGRPPGLGRVVGAAVRRALGRRPARRPDRRAAEPPVAAARRVAPRSRDPRPPARLRAGGRRRAHRCGPVRAAVCARQRGHGPAVRGRRARSRARVLARAGVRGVRGSRVGTRGVGAARRATRQGVRRPDGRASRARAARRARRRPRGARRRAPAARATVAAADPRVVPLRPFARRAPARVDAAADPARRAGSRTVTEPARARSARAGRRPDAVVLGAGIATPARRGDSRSTPRDWSGATPSSTRSWDTCTGSAC